MRMCMCVCVCVCVLAGGWEGSLCVYKCVMYAYVYVYVCAGLSFFLTGIIMAFFHIVGIPFSVVYILLNIEQFQENRNFSIQQISSF